MLHTACRPTNMCVGQQNTSSTCIAHRVQPSVWQGTAEHNKHMSGTHTCIAHRMQPCMVRNCITPQTHVRDAYMYYTPRAAFYVKELHNTTNTSGTHTCIAHRVQLCMVRNCITPQTHVRDAYMYTTPRAAVYGKEMKNTTSKCKGRIHFCTPSAA